MSNVIQMSEVKKRRISDKDWKKVEEYVKKEYSKRKTDSFRLQHERIWKEVDRQVYMKSSGKKRIDPNQKNDWHSSIELGELAKASEIITADTMRLIFPDNRSWNEAHCDLPPTLDPQTGQNLTPSQEDQISCDGAVRALMNQQHQDFGFKSRIGLSVKEALHHGSFVSEAIWESALMVHDGSGIASIEAPVWVPHSMWNCFPDPSPSVMGTNMFYSGSMIIREYTPKWKLEESMNGPGWMPENLKRVTKRTNKNKDVETDDVEIVKYYGDFVIKRDDGDIYLPNSKIVLANDVIIFYAPNELPFPSVIFNGYEKLDVRDPYFVSPLIKLSPMQKVATTLLNKFIDCSALHAEPPILYDGNDPTFVQNGGPVMAPGWKGPTKSLANYKTIDTGDPSPILEGYQLIMSQLKQGTTADSVRSTTSADKTATEVRQESMRSEVRVVDFVDKLEFSLKTFLYMQHELNKRYLKPYTFYNPEMDAPDSMSLSAQQLPQNVRFDIVGSKGILGEEERSQKMLVVTSMAASNPMFAPLLNKIALLKEAYQDAGVKNPERFLNVPTDETQQLQQEIQSQYEQEIQKLQEENFKLKEDLAISKSVSDAKVVEAQMKAQSQAGVSEFKAQVHAQLESYKTGLELLKASKETTNPQVSIAEMGNLVTGIENLLSKSTDDTQAQVDDLTSKVDQMTKSFESMATAINRPRKKTPVRDKSGTIMHVIEE